jgi:hypothetical protein
MLEIRVDKGAIEEVAQRLLAFSKQFPIALTEVVYKNAEEIKEQAVRNAPEGESGNLRASADVEMHFDGDEVVAEISFGGPSAPYAVVVHEHPSDISPPSWQGKVINWHPSGTGPKYLEKALQGAKATLGRDLVAGLRTEMSNIMP